MIHPFGRPDPPVPRLLAALAERGHAVGGAPGAAPSTLLLAAGTEADPMALAALLGGWGRTHHPRVLVVSALGAHPDARSPRLRRLWEIEESARGARLPVLTLRLAPLVGPRSPLWLRLRSRPRLPQRGGSLLNPVAEADVVETIDRALKGAAEWRGWYEVAGTEAVTLAELAELARLSGPRLTGGSGAWEPPAEELAEHRLAEAGPWLEHFGLSPPPLVERAAEWAA